MSNSILENTNTLIGLPPYLLGQSVLLHLPPRRFLSAVAQTALFFCIAVGVACLVQGEFIVLHSVFLPVGLVPHL